mmetsp:Transcript_39253/g.65941  ORF Transcript_39253/g.65941 Transcript_39253/m.65941 type:complete len:213 (-) Transcript_39253:285-923(-)
MAQNRTENGLKGLIFDINTGSVSVQTAKKMTKVDFLREALQINGALQVAEAIKGWSPDVAEKYLAMVPSELKSTSAVDYKSVFMMCTGWEESLNLGWQGFAEFWDCVRLDFKRGDTLLVWDVAHVQCYFQSYRDRIRAEQPNNRFGGAGPSGYASRPPAREAHYTGGSQKPCRFHNKPSGCSKKGKCNMLHKCLGCGAIGSHGLKDCPQARE